MDTNIIGSNTTGITAATDTFFPLYAGNSGSNSSQVTSGANIMPVSGTLKNLYVQCDNGPGAGITRTFWVYKNGTSTGVTMSLTGSGTGAGVSSGSDLVNSTTFVAGDLISLRTAATATTTSAGTIRWTLDASTSPNVSMILGNSGANLATSGNTYVTVSGKAFDNTSGLNVQGVMPTSGTLKNAIMSTGGAAGTGAGYTATLYKNGSPTSITMTISGASAVSATDSTHSISVSPGDVLYWSVSPSGTPTARALAISLEFDPAIDGESVHLYGNSVVDVNSAVRYNAINSPNQASYQSTEAPRQVLTQSAVWRKLYVVLNSAPGAGASFQIQLSVGGAAGSPSVTISGANTTGNDANNCLATAGQTVVMKMTPTGTPTASTLGWGIVSYIPPAAAIAAASSFFDLL
jgi:hypothetical protein